MNKVRLYIDEDASRKSFITALRKANIDILTTFEAGNLGIADPEQLFGQLTITVSSTPSMSKITVSYTKYI